MLPGFGARPSIQGWQAAADESALKVPAGQMVIPLFTSPVKPGDAKQSATASEPAALLLFAGHVPSQSNAASCPCELLNVLAGQRSQTAVPVAALYFPASQILHAPLKVVVPLREPVNPELQRQSSPASDPAGAAELASHATQDAVPVTPLN